MAAAEASPDGLGGVAVHTVPLLGCEDGMVLGKPQLTDVFALIHCQRLLSPVGEAHNPKFTMLQAPEN